MHPGAPGTLGVGTRVGPYEILGLLGAGGMGRVYRARDLRLRREVAIKVLPEGLTVAPDRLARFEREARILATLNHPHIAAIYGVEESAGGPALVLELVPGPTLAQRIAEGLPVERALTFASRIAAALDAAHQQGVIHRDLKPANVHVAPGDVVKVLDFGLAKSWDRLDGAAPADASTVTAEHSHDGAIVGTLNYMSPEQARGAQVDRRTDVWAFGCVLFEMLTGRRVFEGAQFSEILGAIFQSEPDWRRVPRGTPRRVRALLRRTLEKDVSKRASDLGQIAIALDRSVAWLAHRRRIRLGVATAALLVLAGAAAAYRFRPANVSLPRLENPVQVTSAMGVEDYPSLSPDGRFVTYDSNQAGNWDIWISEIGGANAVNRTIDNIGDDRYPSWSPDGRHVAFWSSREGASGYYVMSDLGGPPERVTEALHGVEELHSPAIWSADSRQLAFVTYTPAASRYAPSLRIVTLATREARSIPLPGTQEARLDLSWSHDGQRVAYLDIAQQPAETSRLMVLNLTNGQAVAVTDASLNIRSPIWAADDRALYFVCNQASTWDLWRQVVDPTGAPIGVKERVTIGLDMLHVTSSADGRRVAFAKGRWVSNVWRVPLVPDRVTTWADAQQQTFDQAFIEFAQVSPDGQWLAFSSDRLGNQDLWKQRVGSNALVRLTSDPSLEWAPYWSPDGKRLAFYSNRTGNREVYIMSADGGPARQLTDTRTSLNAGGSWSPDGTEIAYRSERLGSSDLWVTSADGTRSRVLAPSPAAEYAHAWSPDGHWIAFMSDRDGAGRLWRVPARGGAPERLTEHQAAPPVWSRDGAEIYFPGVDGGRALRFWAVALATRQERCVADLTGRRGHIGFQPPSTDGRYLYFMWRDDLGDVWTMDVR